MDALHSDKPSPGPSRAREGRRAPRWTIAFLRSLERTGSAEAAAVDAGIDRTTAYHRRRAHPAFAEEWEAALKRRSDSGQEAVRERVGFWEKVRGTVTPALLSGGVHRPSPGTPVLRCPPDSVRASSREREGGRGREELLASTSLGGKMVRAGPGRWNAGAEERFFDELAATANVKRACAAAGVSTNAVYARRLKRPDFRAKWDAVLETGRAAIEMHLIESAKNSFDPEELDLGDVETKVSVAEAIRIVQLHGNRAQKQDVAQFGPPEREVEEMRERLFRKLQRLRKREDVRMLAEGWTRDQETEALVPPGWVRAEGCGSGAPD